MKLQTWMTKLVLSFVIMSFVTTSFGGAWATIAYAAAPEEAAVSTGDSKSAVGGVLALGLLAVLAGGKKGGSSAPSAKNTTTSTNQPTTQSRITTPTQSSPSQTMSSGLSADETKAFNLLNADRAANGLPALKINMNLVRLAENYGSDMIKRNYFAHYNPEGQSPFDRMRQAGISYRYAGENLAINSNVNTAETAFMNSPGHRANILNSNYTEVGLGVRYSASGRAYVVQEFIGK